MLRRRLKSGCRGRLRHGPDEDACRKSEGGDVAVAEQLLRLADVLAGFEEDGSGVARREWGVYSSGNVGELKS